MGFLNETLKMVKIIKEKANKRNYIKIKTWKRSERQTTDETFAIQITTKEPITQYIKNPYKWIINLLSKTT